MGIAIYFDGGEGVITFTAIVDCRLMIDDSVFKQFSHRNAIQTNSPWRMISRYFITNKTTGTVK